MKRLLFIVSVLFLFFIFFPPKIYAQTCGYEGGPCCYQNTCDITSGLVCSSGVCTKTALPALPTETTYAGCTAVTAFQSCSGSQPVMCIQQLSAGAMTWCCDSQTSCDSAKAGFHQQMTQSFSNSDSNVHGSCGDDTYIDTAIGCIPVLGSDGQNDFLIFILKWSIGIGGGIAFLLIVYGGFMIMTSQGNPERLQAGKELLTSAISGLILLILSVFILNVVGVKILEIPGFGK
ncbi:pilin [Patescibacteria group bacterium]